MENAFFVVRKALAYTQSSDINTPPKQQTYDDPPKRNYSLWLLVDDIKLISFCLQVGTPLICQMPN